MSTRFGVTLMAVALVIYIVLVAQRGWLLLTSGDLIGNAMGVALFVLPLIAGWALWRELSFGRAAARLGRQLEAEGSLPEEDVEVSQTGRVKRADADELFPRYREAVERDEGDWRAWYRLGLVYDGAGDRPRARSAIREAIRRERRSR